MKTIAIIVASFCVVSAAMAQTHPAAAGSRRRQPARGRAGELRQKCCKRAGAESPRRGFDQLREKVLQRPSRGAQKLHGAAETSFTKKCVADAGVK